MFRKRVDIFFFFFFDEETDTTVPVSVDKDLIDNEQELEFITDDTIRKVWNSSEEEWYFSVVDIIQYLTGCERPRKYWNDLKRQLLAEGSQLSVKIGQLKLPSKKDGKMYKTDCVNTEQLLRLIQSIPSKKVEPLQAWSGKTVQQYKKYKGVHKENLRDNMTNTELALNQLAEVATTELSRASNPTGYHEAKDATLQGGEIAGNARKDLERRLGRSVLSPLNANSPSLLDDSDKK